MDKEQYAVINEFTLRSDAVLEEQDIPLYDLKAVAGLVSLFVDGHVPIDKISLPNMPKCDGAVFVTGDSMFPLLKSGDLALYKTTQSRRANLFFGQMYLLEFYLDGEEFITIKYLHQSVTPGCYTLVSENPQYPPKDIPIDSVKALALIKGSVRYNAVG